MYYFKHILLVLSFISSSLVHSFDSYEHARLIDSVQLKTLSDQQCWTYRNPMNGSPECIKDPILEGILQSQKAYTGKLLNLNAHLPYFVVLNRKSITSKYSKEKMLTLMKKELSNTPKDSSTLAFWKEKYLDTQREASKDNWMLSSISAIAGDYLGEWKEAISAPIYREDYTTSEEAIWEIAYNILKSFSYLKRYEDNPFFSKVDANSTLPFSIIDQAKIYSDTQAWFREKLNNENIRLIDHYSHEKEKEASKAGFSLDKSFHREYYNHHSSLVAQFINGAPTHGFSEMLFQNFDHFAPDAQIVFLVGHNMACRMAQNARSIASQLDGQYAEDAATLALNEAYAVESFVLHYLSDLFSAGHIRNPRRALIDLGKNAKWWVKESTNIVSNIYHDDDGWLGLKVCSTEVCGPFGSEGWTKHSWTAYGDYSLLDKKSETNRNHAMKAIQDSFNEIEKCYLDPKFAEQATDWHLGRNILNQVPRLAGPSFSSYKPYPLYAIEWENENFKKGSPNQAFPFSKEAESQEDFLVSMIEQARTYLNTILKSSKNILYKRKDDNSYDPAYHALSRFENYADKLKHWPEYTVQSNTEFISYLYARLNKHGDVFAQNMPAGGLKPGTIISSYPTEQSAFAIAAYNSETDLTETASPFIKQLPKDYTFQLAYVDMAKSHLSEDIFFDQGEAVDSFYFLYKGQEKTSSLIDLSQHKDQRAFANLTQKAIVDLFLYIMDDDDTLDPFFWDEDDEGRTVALQTLYAKHFMATTGTYSKSTRNIKPESVTEKRSFLYFLDEENLKLMRLTPERVHELWTKIIDNETE